MINNMTMPEAMLFDFGGVLAEEGFREGLTAIAARNGLDPDVFFRTADRLIYETGYLLGKASEETYWQALREATGISGTDKDLRTGILERFIMRPAMMAHVDSLHAQGLIVALLSDQTNWLNELDRSSDLFRHFDAVFNSYSIHRSKRDPVVFREVCTALAVAPRRTLFVDDNAQHIGRAAQEGLQTILFTSLTAFEEALRQFIPAHPS